MLSKGAEQTVVSSATLYLGDHLWLTTLLASCENPSKRQIQKEAYTPKSLGAV